jgi:hypothetical protein
MALSVVQMNEGVFREIVVEFADEETSFSKSEAKVARSAKVEVGDV